MFLIPVRIKKIQLKTKALECSQDFSANLNSSKLSCMSLLPARMRMIDLKMKELECSQDFSHYKSMGILQTIKGS